VAQVGEIAQVGELGLATQGDLTGLALAGKSATEIGVTDGKIFDHEAMAMAERTDLGLLV
jgi:hypothetical protein